MNIVVASRNPVKVQASLKAFQFIFPEIDSQVSGFSISSGVSDQPMTESETRMGAQNRVHNASNTHPSADFWVGIEGGIEDLGTEMIAFAWVAILHKGYTGEARTASFFLPPPVADLIRQGDELGVADDKIFGVSNSKQENGAIGLLSKDVIVRETLYIPAVVMALIPFRNPQLYGLYS